MRLGELLVAQGLVTSADVKLALRRQEVFGGRIGENLIAMRVITAELVEAVLRRQHELATAILTAEDLLTRSVRVNGSDHPRTNQRRLRLSAALVACGRLDEALSLAQTALSGHRTRLGRQHPWTKEAAKAVADLIAVTKAAASSEAAEVGFGDKTASASSTR
jgi:hypothetical protein